MLKKVLSMLMVCLLVGLVSIQAFAAEMPEIQGGEKAPGKVPVFIGRKPALVQTADVGDNLLYETEPNDTAANAKTIVNDQTAVGAISGADVDVYKLTLTGETVVCLTAASDAGYLVLAISDVNGEVLAVSEYVGDEDGLYYDVVACQLSAGTYYVLAFDYNESALNYIFYVQLTDMATHTHSWESYGVITEATCIAEGEELQGCDGCGLTKTAVIPMTEHNYSEYITETPSTCAVKGQEYRYCYYCYARENRELPLADHTYGEVQVETAPTCTESGVGSSVCTVCGASDSVPIPAVGHSFENGTCAVCGQEEPPFEDVLYGEFYYDSVKWAVAEGITNGYEGTDLFGPMDYCTREQVVTFLWRAAGEPAPTSNENPFSDVEEGKWYTDAVLWAVEKDITAGYLDTDLFGTGDECTRAQIVTFLHRYAGEPAPASSENPFEDMTDADWFYHPVLWAVEEGITNGYGSSTIFNPEGICTRGQIVTFLHRYSLREIDGIVFLEWPENTTRNEIVTVTIQGQPDTVYDIEVYYRSGASTAEGLEAKTSDSDGYVTWTWKVGGSTTAGTYRIVVTGGGKTGSVNFTVSE